MLGHTSAFAKTAPTPVGNKIRLYIALAMHKQQLIEQQENLLAVLQNIEILVQEAEARFKKAEQEFNDIKAIFDPLQRKRIADLCRSSNEPSLMTPQEMKDWTKASLQGMTANNQLEAAGKHLKNQKNEAEGIRIDYLKTLEQVFNDIEKTEEKIKELYSYPSQNKSLFWGNSSLSASKSDKDLLENYHKITNSKGR